MSIGCKREEYGSEIACFGCIGKPAVEKPPHPEMSLTQEAVALEQLKQSFQLFGFRL